MASLTGHVACVYMNTLAIGITRPDSESTVPCFFSSTWSVLSTWNNIPSVCSSLRSVGAMWCNAYAVSIWKKDLSLYS